MRYKVDKSNSFLFFWGGGNTGGVGKNCLSQWALSDMIIDGYTYSSCEQYMMVQKAILFGDMEIATKIMNTEHPRECKKLGRLVKNFNPEIWDSYKYDIVKKGNYYKFKQNSKFRRYLLSKDVDYFVEASPYDKIWGIGLKETSIGVNDPKNWKGKNLLGFAITEVRDELRKE